MAVTSAKNEGCVFFVLFFSFTAKNNIKPFYCDSFYVFSALHSFHSIMQFLDVRLRCLCCNV